MAAFDPFQIFTLTHNFFENDQQQKLQTEAGLLFSVIGLTSWRITRLYEFYGGIVVNLGIAIRGLYKVFLRPIEV